MDNIKFETKQQLREYAKTVLCNKYKFISNILINLWWHQLKNNVITDEQVVEEIKKHCFD